MKKLPPTQVRDVDCGNTFTAYVTDYGEVYMTGKGDFERATNEDAQVYTIPYPVLLELEIKKVSCGTTHFMSVDQLGRVFALGDGEGG